MRILIKPGPIRLQDHLLIKCSALQNKIGIQLNRLFVEQVKGLPHMKFDTIQKNAHHASTLLKAMSNPHRLLILSQLAHGERCVSELESIVGLSQSALSQHLARLRRDKMVQTRRAAQTIYYSLAGDDVEAVIDTLYSLYNQPRAAASRAFWTTTATPKVAPAV